MLHYCLLRSNVEVEMLVKFLVLAFVGCVVAQGVEDSRCPSVKGQKSVRLPHESDCSRFYICQNGRKHLMPPCPRKKLFDSTSLKCVDAVEAACGGVTTTSLEPEVTELSTEVSILFHILFYICFQRKTSKPKRLLQRYQPHQV